jgi:hypothetical protein
VLLADLQGLLGAFRFGALTEDPGPLYGALDLPSISFIVIGNQYS